VESHGRGWALLCLGLCRSISFIFVRLCFFQLLLFLPRLC
jgi:hypothetical protein